jgi:hypothetical protein
LGEVPVAVVQDIIESQEHLDFVRSMPGLVIQKLGPTFALDQVITLRELGLAQFPQTTSGKVKKMDLAAAVRKFRNQVTERRDSGNEDLELALAAKSESEDPPSSIPREDPILTTIRSVWARVLGLDCGELKPATSIATIADSLTMMQARQLLQKHGLHVSLAELTDNFQET